MFHGSDNEPTVAHLFKMIVSDPEMEMLVSDAVSHVWSRDEDVVWDLVILNENLRK